METEKTFTVLLFASLREVASADSISVDLSCDPALCEAFTVRHLLQGVENQFPVLAPWLPHVRIAVNCAYAPGDLVIKSNDEIALIPPVAGGGYFV